MSRRGWTRYNWLLCRRTYSPMGMKCSQCPCVPLQQQRIQTGMTWTVRRQMRTPAQLPGLIQLFFSSSPPLVRQRTKQRRPKARIDPDAVRTDGRAIYGARSERPVRVGEHPARHGGTCHFTPAIFIIVSCRRCIQFCCWGVLRCAFCTTASSYTAYRCAYPVCCTRRCPIGTKVVLCTI